LRRKVRNLSDISPILLSNVVVDLNRSCAMQAISAAALTT
jgi:hypothetical protein